MNWKFWRKPVEVEPAVELRVLSIPSELVPEVFELMDEYYSLKRDQDNMAKYRLWTKIHSILPETEEGLWTLKVVRSTKIEIREKL